MRIRGFFERHATRVQALFSGLAATSVIYPAAFLVTLGEGTLNLGLIFLMRDSYGATPSLVGWLMSFGTLVYVVGCLFVRPRFSMLRPRYLMLLATGGMVVSVGLLYVLRSVAYAFLFFGLTRLAASFFWPRNSETGTPPPKSANTPRAKAISVAMGMPSPAWVGEP